jgi:hypothetical protein
MRIVASSRTLALPPLVVLSDRLTLFTKSCIGINDPEQCTNFSRIPMTIKGDEFPDCARRVASMPIWIRAAVQHQLD